MTNSSLTMTPTRNADAQLSTDQLADLRELLGRRLLVERSRTDQTRAAVNHFTTSTSAADRGHTHVLLDREDESVSLLERALQGMDNGTYGLCDGCHRPISFNWLSSIPEVRHCVGCMRIG